jgi:Uma2 family endonuclease
MLPLLLEERPAARTELVPLTVEQYHRMISAGILEEGEPIELLDGMLVAKDRGPGMTVHPLHSLVVTKLLLLATRLMAFGCHLRSQTALTIRPRHEPEPDAAIIRGRPGDYAQRHPEPADVSCVIEVADSSLERDRTTKLRIYATAGIPQYCLIDLRERRIVLHEQPEPERGTYREVRELAAGATVDLLLPGGQRFEVATVELLP